MPRSLRGRVRGILSTLPLDLAYLLAGCAFGPFYLIVRRVRGKPGMDLLERLRPRFSALPPGAIWIHSVSVGETLAVRSLIASIRERHPKRSLILSSTTRTGRAVARKAFPDLVVVPSPLDFGPSLRRFLDRAAPSLLVLVELELWPNHLKLCRRAEIPVLVVNARLSERSARGYRRLLRVSPHFLDGISAFLLQDRRHAEAFRGLGIEEERLPVVGNLKYDGLDLKDAASEGSRLREEHGFSITAPLFLAGSTHRGEEKAILDAFASIRKLRPDARLVLAPRHPERVKEVVELSRERYHRLGLRSAPKQPEDPDLMIVDTLGELARLYAMADVVFMGGTLVPVGGHNLMEPAVWGRPLVTGPYLHTVQSMAAALEDAGALHSVTCPEGIAAAVLGILDDETAVSRAREGARVVIAAHEGAVERSLRAIAQLVGDSSTFAGGESTT